MLPDKLEINLIEQVVRSIAAAYRCHHMRFRIRESCVEIFNPLPGRACEKQRTACLRV